MARAPIGKNRMSKSIEIRVDEPLLEKLKSAATREGRTLSDYVRTKLTRKQETTSKKK